MSEKNSTTIVRFADFELDLQTRELRKFGTRLRLEDKPAQLLCLLIQSAPSLLTRTELHALLWPEGVHVDREHGLNKCINQLRLVLADDSAEPRFIETLRGRGYRFIGNFQFVTYAVDGREKEIAAATDSERQPVAHATGNDALTGYSNALALDSAPRHRFRWSRPVMLAALAASLLASFALRGFWLRKSDNVQSATQPAISSVVIGTDGAIDPPDNGFQTHYYGRFTFKPLLNRASGGADRLELAADHMGYFYRSLTADEKGFVLQRDWKLTCVCAVKQGCAHANIDFGALPGIPRFDIELLQEGNRYYVGLTKEISPALQLESKLEFAGAGDTEHPHTFELRYDHITRTTSLWIDGEQRVAVYHGVQQFREDRGLIFGALPYRDSPMGVGVFRAIRFEAY